MSEKLRDNFLRQVELDAAKKFKGQSYVMRANGVYPDVIYRIGRILPIDTMLDWFSSSLYQTGGERYFPYCRVDTELFVMEDSISLVETAITDVEKTKWWNRASNKCAKLLTWVDVGWQGLKSLAITPEAVHNWTSGSGHFRTDEEKVEYIITEGEAWVNSAFAKYAAVRKRYNLLYSQVDILQQYNLEPLLNNRLNPQK